jgi:hypothetical protein
VLPQSLLLHPHLLLLLRLLLSPFPASAGKSEYVQGLTVEECATLLNIDANNKDLMDMVYDTAFAIKNRIYGNRIVLFAPLYIANYCVNSCTYCAFRAGNKGLQVGARRDDSSQCWQQGSMCCTAVDIHSNSSVNSSSSFCRILLKRYLFYVFFGVDACMQSIMMLTVLTR